MDPENRELDLNNIDENFEYDTKLLNPYKVYLLEDNEKLKKQAMEQIISNALPQTDRNKSKKEKNTQNNTQYTQHTNFMGNSNQINMSETFLMSKYNQNLASKNINFTKDGFENFMKFFKESCEIHGLYTLDQKIDYFVHLKGSSLMNIKKDYGDRSKSKIFLLFLDLFKNQATTNPTLQSKRKIGNEHIISLGNNPNSLILNQTHSTVENKTPTVRDTFTSNRSKSLNIDIFYKYISELKNKFKIVEDSTNIKNWENFYNDITLRINSFKSSNHSKNLDVSSTVIDKIKHFINCKEISTEKVILRECEMTHDKFYFLIAKKTFDFRSLQHLDLSKNMLGDLGGCYLLHLLDIYSQKMEYLNISYNKLGKQSTELLTNILQKNNLKLSSLDIGGNQLGDKNFSEICVGISKNTHLVKLFTNNNELGKISSTILGTILRYDKKLKMLDVSKNYFDDNVIGYLLKGLISNVTLETLFINESNLTNHSLRLFETTFSINSSLKELFIEKNNFTSKACELISDFLNKNRYLEYVSLAGNKFKSENVDKILDTQKKIQAKVITKTDFYQSKLSHSDKINFYEYIY